MSLSLPIFKKNFQIGFDNLRLNSRFSMDAKESNMTIQFQTTTDNISSRMLNGFFEGWPNPPDSATHYRILEGSSHVVLAVSQQENQVIGYMTAISDGVSAAYIPHLEVLPAYRGQGIGSELVKRMLQQLNGIYMIDLLCDEDVIPFYEKVGMQRATGMVIRNYQNQSGLPVSQHEPHW